MGLGAGLREGAEPVSFAPKAAKQEERVDSLGGPDIVVSRDRLHSSFLFSFFL